MKAWKAYLAVGIALLSAAALKAVLHLTDSVPFSSDEAVVGLMARHINQGARPVFFYGQAYMGSLDAWLIALAFRFFGESVLAIRLVQAGLYLLYLLVLWGFTRRLFANQLVADLSVIVAAVPPVLVTLYSSATLGGYGESLVLGTLVLWLGYEVTLGEKGSRWRLWLLLGLAAGLGFWTLGIIGVYLLAVGLIGIWQFRVSKIPAYALAAGGFLIGSVPWWSYNLNHNWRALAEAGGGHIYTSSLIERIVSQVLFGFPALLGLRAPWSPDYFPWWLLAFGVFLYLALALFLLRYKKDAQLRAAKGVGTFALVFLVVFLSALLGSRFGIDISGRYLLPLHFPLAVATGAVLTMAWRRKAAYGIALLVAVLMLNAAGTWLAASSADRITTQFDPISSFDNSHDEALMSFLVSEGEMAGYSNYWVAYRMAFLSRETLIYSAELPYKENLSYTADDQRYPAYARLAEDSAQAAYITTKHPKLDEKLRQRFRALEVDFIETQIGPYHVFHGLSRKVTPEEVGFGG